MPEVYRIKKQHAGRDIYNIVIQNPITQEDVIITSIQSALRKGETSEGDFFKKEPEWIDFEQGYIVERREVDETIKRLEKNKIQLVLGEPASGKSIILKNIGFKLAKENREVYVIELKKYSRDQLKLIFENIPKKNDGMPIFIIDDAHLYFADCENLVKDFKRRGKGKLIIGSRETKEIREGDLRETFEFEYLSKTSINIKAKDVTDEMIESFLKGKYDLNKKRINAISVNLEKYKKDLWLLSWSLKSYNPKKDSVEEEEIYENIKDSIRRIKAGKEKPTINADEVFLPLSVFYRFEIPIEQDFLEDQMEIEEDIIKQLIELSEIVETEEIGKPIMLSLNHSSVAELYYEAYQRFPSLGKRIKKIILNQKDKKQLEYCLFNRYITTTDPENAVEISSRLGRDSGDEKGGLTLLYKLTDSEEIHKIIEKVINKEKDIGNIGWCLSGIARASEEVALHLANRINIDHLSSKIDKEEDMWKIGWCMLSIVTASKEVALQLANRINIDHLSSRLNEEKDIRNLGWCLAVTARASKEAALQLVNSINIDTLSAKIEEEEDISEIGWCLSSILIESKEVALQLVNSINIDTLSSKIEEEEDIWKIGECLSRIAGVSKEAALQLANSINIDTLSSRIEKEKNIRNIGWCLLVIGNVSKEQSLQLVRINFDTLLSRLNEEKNIQNIGTCLSGIARASKEEALKMANRIKIDTLSSKIDKEEDIWKIGNCLSGIARVSKEAALQLANRINIDTLLSRIDEEKRISDIGACLSSIARVSEEMALQLADRINIDTLLSKIDEAEDILEIGWCLSYVAEANKELASEIFNYLNPELKKELQSLFPEIQEYE